MKKYTNGRSESKGSEKDGRKERRREGEEGGRERVNWPKQRWL